MKMAKKIFLLVFVSLVSLLATAQNGVGDWRLHVPFVGSNVKTVVETRLYVYYLAGENLFRLDKETNENESLNIVNDLSDMTISEIYYNKSKDYLVVVYSNSHIDIIKSNGSVVNMPEIKDAVMTTSKKINDVTFGSGLIYLATDFGYVVIDDSKCVIKESHLYGEPMVSVAKVGDYLLLSTADKFYYGRADAYHELLSSFTVSSFNSNCRVWPIDDHSFFCMTGWTFHTTMEVKEDGSLTYYVDEDFNYYVEHYMEYKTNAPTFDTHTTEGQFRGSMYEWVTPYETSGFPAITYYTLEETEELSDYNATLKVYAEGEIAKFISGDRDIEEYDAFVTELEGMGLREWEQIYKNAWANYQAAMG